MERAEHKGSVDRKALRERTKRFALDVCRLAPRLPSDLVGSVLVRQLVRAATGVGANQRRATLAQSQPDLIAKLKTVEDEADECEFWLELLLELQPLDDGETRRLHQEAGELRRMVTAGIKTLRARSLEPRPKGGS